MSESGWIGVDLDGTLAHYTEWKGENHIGDPVPAMVERVKAWIEEGVTVKVFTARVSTDIGGFAENQKRIIGDWCERHIGERLEVTCCKDFAMIELWDDRAVQVVMNTGMPIVAVV